MLLCGVCSMASAQSALGFSPSGSACALWRPIKSARVLDSRSGDVSALSCPFLPRRLLDKRWIHGCVLINTELSGTAVLSTVYSVFMGGGGGGVANVSD